MKKAALVDIGNVILNLDFQSSLSKLIPETLADPEARIQSLMEKKDVLEMGELSDEDFVEWASCKLEFDGGSEKFLAAWNDIFSPNLLMWETLRDLKSRGFELILFSNTNQMHADFFMKEFSDVFDLFDGHIFSHQEGCSKPDPEIYRKAIERFELIPEETYYFDDLPENVTTGLQMGLKAWVYRPESHEALTRWLVENLA